MNISLPINALNKKRLGIAFLFSLLIGNAFFLKYNAFRTFNFYDMGSFLDASWRVFKGQQPYIDFYINIGPVHLLLNAFFFHLFSFGKQALLTHLIVVHSVVITSTYFILYKKVPFYITMAVTLLTVPSFYWNVSYPWHDHSAHLWGIIGAALLTHTLPFRSSKAAFQTALICGILAIISIFTKVNIGLAYGLTFLLSFIAPPFKKETLGGYISGISLSLLLLIIVLPYSLNYFEQILSSGMIILKGRGESLLNPQTWLVNYYFLPLVITSFNILLHYQKNSNYKLPWALLLLLAGITFTGIFSTVTGGIIRSANIYLWGIQMAIAFITMYSLRKFIENKFKKIIYKNSLAILFVMTIIFTAISIKYGLELKVWSHFIKHTLGNYTIQSKPLDGWVCHKKQGKALDVIVSFIKNHIPKDQTILNLTDMYVIYALTDRDSYRKIPTIFWPGAMPTPGKQTQKIKKNILDNPPDWIIAHPTSYIYEFVDLDIKEEIESLYTPVAHEGLYLLLKKNASPTQ